MSAKPGRNRPCPCRSGRKYKFCCGRPTQQTRIVENVRQHLETPALIVCFATRGQVSIETFSSALQGGFGGFPIILLTAARKPVDAARNALAAAALDIVRRPQMLPWIPTELLVFWFDDDALWRPKQLRRGVQYLQENPQIDILFGNFCERTEFATESAVAMSGVVDDPRQPYEGAIEVSLSGFHWVVHRASVLQRIGPNPFSCFERASEDFSFCKRALTAGIRMFYARELVIPHVDVEKGLAYIPNRPAYVSTGSSIFGPEQLPHDYGEVVNTESERGMEYARSHRALWLP